MSRPRKLAFATLFAGLLLGGCTRGEPEHGSSRLSGPRFTAPHHLDHITSDRAEYLKHLP